MIATGPSFQAQVAEVPTGVAVVVSGEVDMATSDRFREVLAAALSTEPLCLMLDLGGVRFMDARGLAELVRARRQAGDWGGSVRIVAESAQVRRILAITRLDDMFDGLA